MWDDYDDEDEQWDSILGDDGAKTETLFASSDLCRFVKEAIETKDRVTISAIAYQSGVFKFSISASSVDEFEPPEPWRFVCFGSGTVTFEITLNEFQEAYYHLNGRDLKDSIRVAVSREYGDVCDVVSVGNEGASLFGNGVEVVVRVKEGCMLSFRKRTWLPVTWIKGDLVAFEVDESNLRELNGYPY